MKLDEMNVDTLIMYAESLGIDVTEFHFEALDAMSLDDGSIAYDPRKFRTARRLISALIHEIGHVQTGTYYNYQAPRWLREKAEDTADRMALQMFLPKEELERAIRNGATEVWQLLQVFPVTPRLMKKALWLYFDIEIPTHKKSARLSGTSLA